MYWNKFLRAWWIVPLLAPGTVAALSVDIQGVRLQPDMEGASCAAIVGEYPGVKIEGDQPGQTARICHNAARVNSISISDATLIATSPMQKEIVIRFEHDFPAGVNGKVTARAKLQGFFTTENGVGVPTGDRLNLRALFSQGDHEDPISEPFDFTVGDTLESGIFEYTAKKQYLVAGSRSLKGVLKISLKKPGHKVIFPDKCVISLDSGFTFQDKLETMELPEEGLAPDGEGAKPAEGIESKSGLDPRRLEPVVPETPPAPTPPKPKKPKASPPPPPAAAPGANPPPLQNPPGLEPLPPAGTTP